jgi:hypothetical protein
VAEAHAAKAALASGPSTLFAGIFEDSKRAELERKDAELERARTAMKTAESVLRAMASSTFIPTIIEEDEGEAPRPLVLSGSMYTSAT